MMDIFSPLIFISSFIISLFSIFCFLFIILGTNEAWQRNTWPGVFFFFFSKSWESSSFRGGGFLLGALFIDMFSFLFSSFLHLLLCAVLFAVDFRIQARKGCGKRSGWTIREMFLGRAEGGENIHTRAHTRIHIIRYEERPSLSWSILSPEVHLGTGVGRRRIAFDVCVFFGGGHICIDGSGTWSMARHGITHGTAWFCAYMCVRVYVCSRGNGAVVCCGNVKCRIQSLSSLFSIYPEAGRYMTLCPFFFFLSLDLFAFFCIFAYQAFLFCVRVFFFFFFFFYIARDFLRHIQRTHAIPHANIDIYINIRFSLNRPT